MSNFEIRKATPSDIDVLVAQRHAMFDEMVGGVSEKDGKLAYESYRAWAVGLMKRERFHAYLVTSKDGTVAASGCVWLREVQPSYDRPSRLVPYLLSIYTHPEYRRNGLATLIVEAAMGWAKENGYDRMTLHASSVGRKVYANLGWKRTWEMEFDFMGHQRPQRRRRRATRKRSSSSE